MLAFTIIISLVFALAREDEMFPKDVIIRQGLHPHPGPEIVGGSTDPVRYSIEDNDDGRQGGHANGGKTKNAEQQKIKGRRKKRRMQKISFPNEKYQKAEQTETMAYPLRLILDSSKFSNGVTLALLLDCREGVKAAMMAT